MIKLSQKILDFIDEVKNLNDDQIIYLSKKKGFDGSFVLNQIKNKKVIQKKVPLWANQNLIYPKSISIEQCSSQATAIYKSKLASGNTFADLSGGFGVDSFFISNAFNKSYYCELNKELFDIVSENFNTLKKSIVTIQGDGIEFLKNQNKQFDLIYIDPSRRTIQKNRVYKLEDYSPDLTQHLKQITNNSKLCLIKTSPFLDIKQVLLKLKFVREVHVISKNNDCKEVLYLLDKKYNGKTNVYTVDLARNESFSFDFEQEKEKCNVAMPTNYLYEPNAAILKAGAFQTIGKQFNLNKLEYHSHLYSSDKKKEDFPGRVFKIKAVCSLNKKEILPHLTDSKANITKRNFPLTTDQIRKKLKLKDGGTDYLFATTLCNQKKVIVVSEKLK
ncbi:MAG: class I SAM-dependent methyltransferase [Flavobacteriales bacterium]